MQGQGPDPGRQYASAQACVRPKTKGPKFLLFGLAGLLSGCFAFAPKPHQPWSWGSPSRGLLQEGMELPEKGVGYVRARPGDAHRYGTRELVEALQRAAASVQTHFPGGAPLRVGDITGPGGGEQSRHGSHRSGRDVDLIFYVLDGKGRSVQGRGWLGFDRFGLAREDRAPGGKRGSGELFYFDDARNWHLIRTLLADPSIEVQWVFCSQGLKARLLAYARAHEASPEILFRAAWVLHQPGSGNPHRDHFHIRIACSAAQRALGCVNDAPEWPWIRRASAKAPPALGVVLDDEALVALLAGDMRMLETSSP